MAWWWYGVDVRKRKKILLVGSEERKKCEARREVHPHPTATLPSSISFFRSSLSTTQHYQLFFINFFSNALALSGGGVGFALCKHTVVAR
jgi:hypothetical protein